MNDSGVDFSSEKPQHNLAFWFHVLITLLAWVGPFLFSWYLMVAAYLIVVVQFLIFNRCLLNASHSLESENHNTFYSYLFERLGIRHNKAVLHFWVRRIVYPVLAVFTVLWQLVLGYRPLLF